MHWNSAVHTTGSKQRVKVAFTHLVILCKRKDFLKLINHKEYTGLAFPGSRLHQGADGIAKRISTRGKLVSAGFYEFCLIFKSQFRRQSTRQYFGQIVERRTGRTKKRNPPGANRLPLPPKMALAQCRNQPR